MVAKYLVTFDLQGASKSRYEQVYAWAHRIGGYRYFRLKGGKWGRLPSTTIVVPLEAATPIAARELFQRLLEAAGYTPTHVAVCRGHDRATLSTPLDPREIPDYARQAVRVGS